VKGIRVPDGQRISNSRVKPKGDVSSELFHCLLWHTGWRWHCNGGQGICKLVAASERMSLLPCGRRRDQSVASRPAAFALHRNPHIAPAPPISADEAVAGGAAGLVYIRVKEGGEIEAAKPVMEGLTPEQQAELVAQLQASLACTCSAGSGERIEM